MSFSSSTEETAITVADNLQQFRLLGQFDGAHSYIGNLPPEFTQQPLVVFRVVTLYLNQGHFIRAESALAFGDGNAAAESEEAALLHILKAYIAINRECKLTAGVQIAQEVCATWLNYLGRTLNAN